MSTDLRFDGRVAIITGAGNGLGRSHALLLASRGARVVVNDLGGSAHGAGKSSAAADAVVADIKKAGGEAVANYDSVEDGAKIVQCALDTWKRIDIVVNNAGILRDTSFQKMSQDDWDLIYRVHVLGGFRVTHAAWNHMRDASYGRILFTGSAAGIYGNFGQANYAMAKLGLVGLSNTLAIEGKKKNVLVNTIAPIAGSRLTETVLPKDLIDALKPEVVSPLVAYLAHESCEESGGLFDVGGGFIGKLRWERAEGETFKLNRPLTPEAVASKWTAITSFEKTTHPADITQSMQPIINNLGTAKEKAKGGNELIDVDAALGYEFPPVTSSYDDRDAALYALGVGAAQNPLDQSELQLVYEMHGDGFRVLPTFGVAPALRAVFDMAKAGKQAPGLNYGFDRVLHGEQYTEIKRPLPPNAKLVHKIKIKDIFDKGKNALVISAITTSDDQGNELAYNELTTFVRGAGGWGGERGPSADVNVPPERAPDATITEKTSETQALLYRLSGDWNPLHVDPNFATAFGFQKPILHGLCTFGFAARHVIKAFCKNDPRLFKSIKVRFADTVFPGETLVTEMWKESDTRIVFRCKVKERDKVVISNAAVELFKQIPAAVSTSNATATATATASATPTATATPSAPMQMTSEIIFSAIAHHIANSPELVGKVQTIFQWKLTSPNSEWAIDLKSGKGSCVRGTAEKPDVTMELSDADFMAMAGDPDGMKLAMKMYMGGKLKISGNVMASQKLGDVLKGVDREAAMKAFLAKNGAGSAAGAPAAAPTQAAAASDEVKAEHIFFAIGHHLEKNPDLAGKVGKVFQWKVSNPDSTWVLDLKNGKGSCTPGVAEKPETTLELSNVDFIAMSTGKADAMKLYMGGKLKIAGDVMASQKLEFLKSIDREAAMKAYIAKHGGGGGGASASAGAAANANVSAGASASAGAGAAKPAKAPALFKALGDRLAKNPSLAKEIGAVLQFNLKSPESKWTVDLAGSGAVREGIDAKAAATFTIAEEDLLALVKDPSRAKDLYMRGNLRVESGDARLAQKLGFLKDLS